MFYGLINEDKMKRVVIYARVSTKEQNVSMQLEDLRNYSEARNYHIVNEYIDFSSGSKSDEKIILKCLKM